MVKKTKLEAEKTRQAIVESAIEVFYVNGVSASSIKDIVERANVTRGAFYWYFKNKEAILDYLLDQVAAELDELSAISKKQYQDPVSLLKALGKDLLTYALSQERNLRTFSIFLQMTEKNKDYQHFYEHCLELRRENHQELTSLFRQAQKANLICAHTPPEVLAFSYNAYTIGILDSWLFYSDDIALSQVSDNLIEQFFVGCTAVNPSF